MFRQAVSILLLPFMAAAAVPWWLATAFASADSRWGGGVLPALLRGAGAAVFLAGLGLFLWCVLLFARVGRGTLAPWDPTRALVAAGPYRSVRNPMISGVAAMLLGETLFLGSRLCGAWCAVFLCVNHVYFLLSEEPGLEKRFGEAYRDYKRDVPRWVPRLRRRP